MKTLIVGHGGRESALAMRMAEDSSVYAWAGHRNPSLVRYTQESGGMLVVGDVCDGEAIAQFAVDNAIDIVMVSADNPLEAGVVDCLRRRGVAAVGPTRAGAEIEWNKFYSRQMVEAVAPDLNPWHRLARTEKEVEAAFAELETPDIAVKPIGLTGGKGVKVMGPHLKNLDEAREYALGLAAAGGVIIEEKINGNEFTIQCISDGKTVFFPPPTYDYPYRLEGDKGPGTGGMGSISLNGNLPFVTDDIYRRACDCVTKVVAELRRQERIFNGIMNAGFFVTNDGKLKVIEFNARFGDPECINIMELLDCSWVKILSDIVRGQLRDVPLKPHASAVVYLVSPDYAYRSGEPYRFTVDEAAVRDSSINLFFASVVRVEKAYETIGTSRVLALAKNAPTLADCLQTIYSGIDMFFPEKPEHGESIIDKHFQEWLQYREDIGRGVDSPLFSAVQWSVNPAVIEELLKAGSDINARDKDGETSLHRAARKNKNPAVIEMLLKLGGDINVRDKDDLTPLHVAVESNENPAIIEVLLKAGSDVNARGNLGQTPLHLAAGGNINPAVIEALLKAGGDVNARDEDSVTPLHSAAFLNENPAVIEALLKASGDVKAGHKKGGTPLHLAAMGNKNPAVIKALLKAGGNVNARDEEGWTPLHLAAGGNKNPAIIETLLKVGGDVNAWSKDGETLLHFAAWHNKNPAIIELLLKLGGDVNVRDMDGLTPLHMAASSNKNPAVIEVLLKAGGDVNAKDRGNWTPLHLAAVENKNPAVMEALLKAGANPNAKNDEEKTPIDYIDEGKNDSIRDTSIYRVLRDAQGRSPFNELQ